MGKKHVAAPTKEELLKESEKIESKLNKEVQKISSGTGEGKVYIYSSYNNTILTLTDKQGRVLHWVTAGSIGFKGTKKGTPFAASKAAEAMSITAEKMKIRKIEMTDGGVFRLKGQLEGDSFVTEIKEGTHEAIHCEPMFGYSIYSDKGHYAWIPYHAIVTVYFEIDND